MNRDVAYYVQLGLLTVLICGYSAFTVQEGRIVVLGIGFALFALAAGIAIKLGQSTTSGREMIIVAFAAALAFSGDRRADVARCRLRERAEEQTDALVRREP